MNRRIRVWDLPVRIFHWSLVLVVAAAIVTGTVGGNAIDLHGQLGIVVTGLIGFRLAWGLIGTRTARFNHFVRGPGAIRAYLQGRWQGIGHNPLGALSVLALLGLFGFQAVSGLFTNDDIAFSGPLRTLVDKALSDRITGIHKSLQWWLVALVAFHVLAVLYYRLVKKDDMLGPMVRGWKQVPRPQDEHSLQEENTKVNAVALVVAILVGFGCAVLATGVWLPSSVPVPASVTPDW